MAKLVNRLPDFGAEYDQSKMNQLVNIIKQVIGGVDYPVLKVVEVDGSSYTLDGTEGIIAVSATATVDADIYLPAASLMKGRTLYFMDTENNATAHPFSIISAGSDIIDNTGNTFSASADNIRVILWCDGVGWYSVYIT